MRLVLVRHGQTASNISHALDTDTPGASLDETGFEQARLLAENFEQLVGATPSVIYASPLLRTRQTAEPLARKYGLEPIIREGIREVIAGDIEMSTERDDIRTYMHTVFSWVQGEFDRQMPGAEDGWQTRARFGTVISEAMSAAREDIGEDACVVLVLHGAISRVIAATLSQDISAELVARNPMDNTGTTTLEWVGGTNPWIGEKSNWRALTWSDQPIDSYELTGGVVEPLESKLRG